MTQPKIHEDENADYQMGIRRWIALCKIGKPGFICGSRPRIAVSS